MLMCYIVLQSGKLLFAKDCGLIPGLFKLGGCEITFILCDQFCLPIGNKDELNPAIQGLPTYGPQESLNPSFVVEAASC